VSGIGGSDLTPALERLAADAAVEAAVVITDGAIKYPREAMPYAVLWALTTTSLDFEPAYGQVVEAVPAPRRAGRGRARRRRNLVRPQ
jgi:predicted metal-dependent peptidase